jgi:hypothetical protein
MLRPYKFASFAFSAAKFPPAWSGAAALHYSKIRLVKVTAEPVSGVKA